MLVGQAACSSHSPPSPPFPLPPSLLPCYEKQLAAGHGAGRLRLEAECPAWHRVSFHAYNTHYAGYAAATRQSSVQGQVCRRGVQRSHLQVQSAERQWHRHSEARCVGLRASFFLLLQPASSCRRAEEVSSQFLLPPESYAYPTVLWCMQWRRQRESEVRVKSSLLLSAFHSVCHRWW